MGFLDNLGQKLFLAFIFVITVAPLYMKRR